MNDNHDLQDSVIRILSGHQGHSKAIKGLRIARLLGLRDDRQVRSAIRDLIADGEPIAAAVQKPFGYFLIEDLEEAREYRESLRSRIIKLCIRLREFKRGAGHKLDAVIQGKLI